MAEGRTQLFEETALLGYPTDVRDTLVKMQLISPPEKDITGWMDDLARAITTGDQFLVRVPKNKQGVLAFKRWYEYGQDLDIAHFVGDYFGGVLYTIGSVWAAYQKSKKPDAIKDINERVEKIYKDHYDFLKQREMEEFIKREELKKKVGLRNVQDNIHFKNQLMLEEKKHEWDKELEQLKYKNELDILKERTGFEQKTREEVYGQYRPRKIDEGIAPYNIYIDERIDNRVYGKPLDQNNGWLTGLGAVQGAGIFGEFTGTLNKALGTVEYLAGELVDSNQARLDDNRRGFERELTRADFSTSVSNTLVDAVLKEYYKKGGK